MANRNMKVDQEWALFRDGLEGLLQARAQVTEARAAQRRVELDLAGGLAQLKQQHADIEAEFVARKTEEGLQASRKVDEALVEQTRAERQVRAAGAKLPGLVASVIAGVLGKGSSEQVEAEPGAEAAEAP